MGARDTLRPFIPNWLLEYWRDYREHIKGWEPYEGADVMKDIRDKYKHGGDLLDLFANNKGLIVHKWHHYIPLYERYLTPFRKRETRFLEIGVSAGGSLQMWRKYLGEKAIVFGVDIDPACQRFDGLAGRVRIGSQADKYFLESVVQEMGGIDVVLDDGSHQMAHIRASLECLFPLLSDSGIYIIEDLHSAYWRDFGGGYRAKDNFFSLVRDAVDDMHHWYHRRGIKLPGIGDYCSGIHIHDSMVVLEKNAVYQPVHSRIG